MSTRSLGLAGLAVVAGLVLGGCGGYDDNVVQPPEAVESSPAAPPSAPPDCGDPTRSYAPVGALPSPG
ncbi:MAG: hypothetical protein Q8O61_18285, partial [Nocardioides sp.]|nr:hypothetical protein [Nocardioides sp.]